MRKKLLFVTQAAMIAALYCVLTMLVSPIATGPLQFRVSEALMLLPALMPAAVPGLYLGCVLANLLMGLGWVDVVFGALATLLAAIVTRLIAKRLGLLPEQTGKAKLSARALLRKGAWLLPLPSVALNALIVGFYLPLLLPASGAQALWVAILISMGQLAWSEAQTVFILGLPFYLALRPVLVRIMKFRDSDSRSVTMG